MFRHALIFACAIVPASLAIAQTGISNGWEWERLAREGDTTPSGDTWAWFGVPAINNGVASWWAAEVLDPGFNSRLMLNKLDVTQQIADSADAGTIGTDGAGLPNMASPHVSADGRVLYNSSQGAYIWESGVNTQVATQPAITTALVDETPKWGEPVLANGEAIFPAGLDIVGRPERRHYASLLSADISGTDSVQRIASDQSTVPGLTGTAIQFVPLSDTAAMSSWVRLATDGQRTIMNASDVLSDTEGIYIRNTDGTFETVADQSTLFGPSGSDSFESFTGHVALTSDTAVFVARDSAGVQGIYTSKDGVIEKAVDTSMIVRTDYPTTLDYIGAVAISGDTILFEGCWWCSEDGHDLPQSLGGLFAIIDGQVHRVLDFAHPLDGRTIHSAHITADSFDGSNVVAKVFFNLAAGETEQLSGIYKIAIPTPSSLALLSAAGLLTLRRRRD